MKVALVAAMPEEVAALLSHLENKQEETICGINFYTGKIKQHEVVISQMGIGKVNAAITATLLYEHFKPNLMINAGAAGGIGDKVNIGDVVVSRQVAHHDVDVTAFDYVYGQVPKLPESFVAAESIIEVVANAYSHHFDGKVIKGLIVSGDQFINDVKKVKNVLQYFPKAIAIDMESAAIGQACYQLKLPFIIVRSISDKADNEAKSTFFDTLSETTKRSADAIVEILKLL